MGQQNHPRSWLRGFPTDPGHLYNNFEGDEIVALLEYSDQVCVRNSGFETNVGKAVPGVSRMAKVEGEL